MNHGTIRKIVSNRGYAYVANDIDGVSTWMHVSDFHSDPSLLVEGAHVEYSILDYLDRKKIARTKAVQVRIVSDAKTENIYEPTESPISMRVPEPEEPKKIVALSASNPAAGREIASKSLALDHARTKRRIATPRARKLLESDEHNIRPRGTTPPSKSNDEGGE